DALVVLHGAGRQALPAHAVEAVAAGDEVAGDLVRGAALAVTHDRRVRIEAVDADVLGFVDGRRTGGGARVHQVARDLGLSVDGHVLAAGEAGEVDAVALAVEAQLDPAVDQPLGVQPLSDAGLVEQVDCTLLEYAGADAAQHVVAALAFEDDRVDARPVQ